MVVALLVRVAAWLVRPAILPDSADLLGSAAAATAGVEGAILRAHHHPLPVWLLATVGRWFDPEWAGSLLAAVAGALGVWPLHVLARTACGRHAATVACVIYAVLPKLVSVGSVPLAEAWFLPLFLAAFAAAATARVGRTNARRGGRLVIAGAWAGLAYLCRPEGLIAGIAVPCLALAQARRGRKLLSFGVVVLGFVLVAAPWVAALSAEQGAFALSPKKDLARFAGVARAPLDQGPQDLWSMAESMGGAAASLWGALGAGALIAVLGALPRRRWAPRPRRVRVVLLVTVAVLFTLLMRLRAGWGYAGGRHALAAAVLLLPYVGEGVLALTGFLSRAVRRRTTALALTTLAAIPIGAYAILRPDGEGGEAERHLGRVVAAKAAAAGDRDVVIGIFTEPLVVYYADRSLRETGGSARGVRLLREHGRLLSFSADLLEQRRALAAHLAAEEADWIVLDLFDEVDGSGAPRRAGSDLARALVADGVLGAPVVAAGSELAAFPVVRVPRKK